MRLFSGFFTAAAVSAAVWPAGAADFVGEVQPILEAHCLACHNPNIAKGDLSFSTKAEAFAPESELIVPGDPANSALYLATVPHEAGAAPDMPDEGDPLGVDETEILRQWIEEGADWPDGVVLRERSQADLSWWAYQALAQVPEGAGIDTYIDARLGDEGLARNPPADRRTLIRRACYDLWGMPPTPEEVAEFVQSDDPLAYEKLIGRLLASPRYGERWGRHWLDVVRFGESNGFERNVLIHELWPFRDYVISSLNEDKPFDQFIREHLAGDVIDGGDPTAAVGTAFLVAGPYDNVGNQDAAQKAQIRANTLDEIIAATSGAFLGLTVGCARCHDHKFDPISQRDYYQLYATFAGVRHGVAELGAPLGKVWIGTRSEADAAGPLHVFIGGSPARPAEEVVAASLSTLGGTAEAYALAADAPEAARREALADWITSPENPLTARVLANRLWHYHFGTGIVDTPSDLGWMGGRPTHPELLDFLAARLRHHGWKIKAMHREIMLSATYQQSSAWDESAGKIDRDARLLWRFPPRRLSAEEVRDTFLVVGGVLDLSAMGGPGFRLYQHTQDNVCTYEPLDQHGPETYRRAVYHQNVRASVVDLMTDFDQPDCAFSTPRRATTTTPLQALTLLNHSFTMDMADGLAARASSKAGEGASTTVQLEHLFQILFQRPPVAEETARCLAAIDGGLTFPSLCRALLNSSELIYLD